MTLRLPDRWIWDSWYVWDGDVCHAFYLCASRGLYDSDRRHRNTNVGHAVSKDLITWEVLPDALSPSESPAFDSWTTWTGSTVRGHDGNWWMFYTGTSREDGGLIQRIGAAISTDLISWSKIDDCLIEADPHNYEILGESEWHDQAWRDPWVYWSQATEEWRMLVTARAKSGGLRNRGTIGVATSSDLKSWRVLQPLTVYQSEFGQLEVLQFEIVDGIPVLIFSCDWPELADERLARQGRIGATYSVVVPADMSSIDLSGATPFLEEPVYAGRLLRHPEKGWFLIGFRNLEDEVFVGELCDAIPVAGDSIRGIQPRS